MKYFRYGMGTLRPKMIGDLVRIGNKTEDGGYVISARQIVKTKVLLGLGINYDWSFEEEFKDKNAQAKLYCYDFSVGKTVYLKNIVSSFINLISLNSYTKEIFNKRTPLPVFIKPIHGIGTYFKFGSFFKPSKGNYFFQKGVSDVASPIFVTTDQMFKAIDSFDQLEDNSIFVKMDIETSEYDILEDLLTFSPKINGMVIEFHDLKHFWNDFSFLMEQVKKDFEIIHIHGNNSGGYVPGTEVPNLLEITVIKRELLTNEEMTAANDRKYPLKGLDSANLPHLPDMAISFNS